MKKLSAVLAVILVTMLAAVPVLAKENLWITVPYTDESVSYDGFWRVVNNPNSTAGSELMGSRTLNTFVEFTFEGTGVRWLGTRSPAMGHAMIYLDGRLIHSSVDGYSPESKNQEVILSITGLREGTHTLRIVPAETKSEAASMAFVSIDSFQYIPTLEKAVHIARNSINLPVGGFEVGAPVGKYFPADKVERLEAALANAEALLTSTDSDAKLAVISELNQARQAMEDAVITVTIPDSSGNGLVGTITGGPKWIEGPVGMALSFNGQGDEVRIDGVSVSETSSIEFWLQMPPAVAGGWQNILGVRGSNTDRSPGLWHQGDGDSQTLHLSTLPNWTGFNHIGPEGEGTLFDPEEWYHIALVKDGAYYTLYVDAEHVITVETGEGMTPGEYLLLGGRNVNIDDLRIWDRVRTQEEIAADYTQALTGTEEGLAGYWTFDSFQ